MGRINDYDNKKELVREMNLTSDLFAGKVFEKPEVFAELLEILLDRKVEIKDVRSQYTIRNIENHSVILDIYGESVEGELFHMELQNRENDNHVKRMRYCGACIDVSLLEKGTKYLEMPKVCQIFISKQDFAKGNKAIYKVERTTTVEEVNHKFQNGRSEIYFNLSVKAKSRQIRELQRYFLETNPDYDTKYFPKLRERVRKLKCSKEGVDMMCEIMDRIERKGIQQGIRTSIVCVLKERGKVSTELKEALDRQDDETMLYQWLSLAVHCQTPKKFMQEIKN